MTKSEIEKKYKLNDNLIRIKLLQYIPVLVISQLSTMLILSVDGIIVSNYVGQEALAAVQIFHPVTAFLGVFTAIISNGTAHCLSARIVKNDFENLKYVKAAITAEIIVTNAPIIVAQEAAFPKQLSESYIILIVNKQFTFSNRLLFF